jgi:hypothetical protein
MGGNRRSLRQDDEWVGVGGGKSDFNGRAVATDCHRLLPGFLIFASRPRVCHCESAVAGVYNRLRGLHRCFSARAYEGVVRDVEVAKDGQEECVMDSNAVGKKALEFRDNRAAHDRGHQ